MLRTKQVAFKNTTAIEQMKSRQQAQQVQQPVSYQTTAQPVAQRPMQVDYYTTNAIADKKARNKEKWDKAGVICSGALGAGVLIYALISLSNFGANRALAKQQLELLKAQTEAAKKMSEKGADVVGEFDFSKLEFRNLIKDESIFDLRNSKSLHAKVKTFFIDLLEKGKIPEEIAERAGILGEGGTNSVLLLGGSGVGKTEVIKAYAKAAEADYVAIKVSDFANSYVNGTSKNISEMIDALIKRAKENPKKQLVISLDEVDALVKVTLHDTNGEISKNRQSLLTGIDALLEIPNIKLFTSSNANIESLDGAFLRRCGYNFEVPMPDKEQLLEALKFQLRKCKGAFENNGEFFKNNAELDSFLQTLIDRKCAFGDVKNIVKAAEDKYALDMFKTNQPKKKFSVKYLKEVLSNIETTAGEKAAREGSFV